MQLCGCICLLSKGQINVILLIVGIILETSDVSIE